MIKTCHACNLSFSPSKYCEQCGAFKILLFVLSSPTCTCKFLAQPKFTLGWFKGNSIIYSPSCCSIPVKPSSVEHKRRYSEEHWGSNNIGAHWFSLCEQENTFFNIYTVPLRNRICKIYSQSILLDTTSSSEITHSPFRINAVMYG